MKQRVANLPAAVAVLNADPARQVELWSPENAAEIQGVQWFVMLERALRADFPDRDPTIVLDCGSRGDLAIEAFRLGLKAVALNASAAVASKVADVAKGCGGRLYNNPIHP